MKVLVFGHSENPDRYSHIAANLLLDYKHQTIKFNPRVDDPKLLDRDFDTVTLYVNKTVADKFQDVLLGLNCKRVIFNPGTENDELEKKFYNKGIEVVRGCTLVMLRTSQF